MGRNGITTAGLPLYFSSNPEPFVVVEKAMSAQSSGAALSGTSLVPPGTTSEPEVRTAMPMEDGVPLGRHGARYPCLSIRIFERCILGFRKKLAQKSGVARTARTIKTTAGKCRAASSSTLPIFLGYLHMRNIN